ncbi:MAG: hypothetical protein HYU71_08820 [Bacteroidetes bacterium]|nr:hypothetical protein [Bacteroidota bacterium]
MPQLIRRNILPCLLCTLLVGTSHLNAQVVWETHTKEIYPYLSRMAQKGMIQFDDNIRPLSRKYIADCLDSLSNHYSQLSATEKKELTFYRKEYGNELAPDTVDSREQVRFFRKDPYERWRSFSATGKKMLLQIDPVFSAATIRGSGKSVTQSSSGLHFWGYAGKHFGFQFFYDDITESGKGIDSTRRFTPETGMIRKDTTLHSSQNFSRFRGSISYSWKNGSVSFGQDHLLWGYGQAGKIVLSDKAPAFPFIRLDYQPFSWLRFNYTHTWLNSAIIDSSRTYPTGNTIFGGQRNIFIPKFMATHSFQIRLNKGLYLAAGESIVYSDQLDIGYLFPLMFFKVYDNIVNRSNIRAGSNGQLFFQLSSRNQLPKTHLYTTVFIDEIRISSIFNKTKSRNQLGFTLGASVTDVVLPYLTLGLEYTRVNPFVYRNLIPAQDYTSHDYFLGDWMGNNFDRLTYTLRYTPVARFKCQLSYQTSRKGGSGTLAQQYFQQPQPDFLFDLQHKQQELAARFSYELIHNLQLSAFYSSLTTDNRVTFQKSTVQTYGVGFNYGW